MTEEAPWLDQLTIGRVLLESARRFRDHEALVFPPSGLRMTYAELAAAARATAKGLLAMGVRPGEHIGVWSPNLPEWVLLQFGAATVGAVLVTINPAYRSHELAYAIEQSDIVALFMADGFRGSDFYAIFREVGPDAALATGRAVGLPAFPKLRQVVAVKPGAPEWLLPWSDFVGSGAAIADSELDAIESRLRPHDAINIQYTSGTTGAAKAAMLTHRNILLNAWYCTACQELTETDRICVAVPFYHCFGCVMGSLGAVTRGATMVIPGESFEPAATLDALERERCTSIYGVPTMFVAMLDDSSFGGRRFAALRTGVMAGSPCPVEVLRRVVDRMGCRDITIAYGQTETSPVLTQSRTDDPLELRIETVGRSLPGVEIKIVHTETGDELGEGQPGEICARGHGVMLGYYKDPDATARTIDRDGWVHTGDIAVRRPDGSFQITGRLKDMLIRGGENIYPREIEEYLFTHPAIMQASAFGVPDSKYGEELCVWVQLRHGGVLTTDELREFCRAGLARFKVPRYVRFVDQFPTTVSGKIQKFKMREAMCQELNSLALPRATPGVTRG